MLLHKTTYLRCIVLVLSLAQPQSFADDNEAKADKPEQDRDDFWQHYDDTKTSVAQPADVSNELHIDDIVEAPQAYSYAAFDKPNPFIPPPLANYISKYEIPIVNSLQRYNINSLMVGGIWLLENKERRALVVTPQGEGVIVGIGDFIGNRGGKLVSINAARIVAREFSAVPDGSRHFQDFELWLGNETPRKKEAIVISTQHMQGLSAGSEQGFIETKTSGMATSSTLQNEVNKTLSQQNAARDSSQAESAQATGSADQTGAKAANATGNGAKAGTSPSDTGRAGGAPQASSSMGRAQQAVPSQAVPSQAMPSQAMPSQTAPSPTMPAMQSSQRAQASPELQERIDTAKEKGLSGLPPPINTSSKARRLSKPSQGRMAGGKLTIDKPAHAATHEL